MKLGLIALALCLSCKTASAPSPDVVEAGAGVATDLCSLIEGTDSTLCATVEEIGQIVQFIITTFRAGDAGGAPPGCTALPNTGFCATKPEVSKGISLIVKQRAAKLQLDAGHK